MKVLPLLLAASLVGNAAWIISSVRTPDTPASISSAGPSGSVSQPSTLNSQLSSPSPTDVIAALKAQNPETLRDLLRAAGLPDQTVRSIVGSAVWAPYRERMKALQPKPDPDKPWWKQDNNDYYSRTNREQRAEIRRLQREATEESLRILGPDKNNSGWGWQDTRYNFVSEEKRKDIQEVEQDYQDLIQEVQQDMQGFALPSDAEKIRFLQEEQKRDIEALMTPEERVAYDLRMSNTAQQLRWKMTQYEATEQEYLAIFPLQKAFDDKYNQPNDGYSPQPERDQNYWKERREAEKQIQDQIKSIIGEERYAESQRLQDNDYRQLEAATRRLEPPPDTPARVYALREGTASSAQQIADNASLSTDQKKQALTALAASTRDQVRASLGAEGAEAYFKNNGMGWLKEIEKGNVITFNKEGTGWSTKQLPKAPPKPAK
jgi:hypothetical protein